MDFDFVHDTTTTFEWKKQSAVFSDAAYYGVKSSIDIVFTKIWGSENQ